jgi:DNA-3-methyladenine glycosylase
MLNITSSTPLNPQMVYPRAALERPTLLVARQVLGQYLWVNTPQAPNTWCRIVETEAYTGDDPACHAYAGRTTGRAAHLLAPPGTAYVYLIYGLYHCLNIVTEAQGTAGAVLIRAIEPLNAPTLATHGPGRLCKALGITTAAHNGLNLLDPASPLVIVQAPAVPDEAIVTTTRIGIKHATDWPWRFYIEGNRWVSVKAKPAHPPLP